MMESEFTIHLSDLVGRAEQSLYHSSQSILSASTGSTRVANRAGQATAMKTTNSRASLYLGAVRQE
jgi:hypothetical protein